MAAVLACAQNPEPPASGGASIGRAAAPVFYDVGVRPRAIAVADFNGDEYVDVAVANGGDGTVTLLFGDGAGRLGALTSFAAGAEPVDVDAVDLDRDGAVDLVMANHETPRVTVLLNDGLGLFAPAPGSPFDTGARPHIHSVTAGDFDGDGWTDVAVESADTDEVRILRGGPEGLTPAISVPVGTMPYYHLGVGQMTEQGLPHLLIPGHGDRTVRVIESVGGRMSLAPERIHLAGQPWKVVGGDVSGDGRDDIVVVETDAVSIWLADGRGFVQAPGSPFSIRGASETAIGDLDGDGTAEVVVGPWDGDEVTVLRGGAAARSVRMCERPIGLAIADLDGDGRGELMATCTHTNQLAVLTVQPR